VVLERTGHLGSITRPDAFAALVCDFVNGAGKGTRTEETEATGTEAHGGNGFTQRNGATETNGRQNGYFY
jgi:hypothetical protein